MREEKDMSKTDDGGQVYPIVEERQLGEYSTVCYITKPGMTLRDHFAGLAMQGILAAENDECFIESDDPNKVENPKTREQKIAEYSYMHADAMIAQRNK
jgi:hypothetical protein